MWISFIPFSDRGLHFCREELALIAATGGKMKETPNFIDLFFRIRTVVLKGCGKHRAPTPFPPKKFIELKSSTNTTHYKKIVAATW